MFAYDHGLREKDIEAGGPPESTDDPHVEGVYILYEVIDQENGVDGPRVVVPDCDQEGVECPPEVEVEVIKGDPFILGSDFPADVGEGDFIDDGEEAPLQRFCILVLSLDLGF